MLSPAYNKVKYRKQFKFSYSALQAQLYNKILAEFHHKYSSNLWTIVNTGRKFGDACHTKKQLI